jgi:hypothetical protein
LPVFVNQNSRIFVEADIATVWSATFFTCPHNHTSNYFTFFHCGSRDGVFDGSDENIAN